MSIDHQDPFLLPLGSSFPVIGFTRAFFGPSTLPIILYPQVNDAVAVSEQTLHVERPEKSMKWRIAKSDSLFGRGEVGGTGGGEITVDLEYVFSVVKDSVLHRGDSMDLHHGIAKQERLGLPDLRCTRSSFV